MELKEELEMKTKKERWVIAKTKPMEKEGRKSQNNKEECREVKKE